MELIIRRLTKGLDLLPLSRNTAMASVGVEDSFGRDQFAADLSLSVIHSVSNISCETGRSIRFFHVYDSMDSTRNPFGLRKIFLNNYNGMS